MRAAPLSLGAPGVYRPPEAQPRVLAGVRMDVCAFVGVAPRGPVREPVLDEAWRFDRPCVESTRSRRRSVAVAVESFDDYRRLFGGFEGPGRLPFAVASFFEQGGRRCYVVRVVHEYGDAAGNAGGVARGPLAGAVPSLGSLELVARSEGAWGNRLRAALGYSRTPLVFDAAAVDFIDLDASDELVTGSLLRLVLASGDVELRFVTEIRRSPRSDGPGQVLRAIFDSPVPSVPESADVVTAELLIDDGRGRREGHTSLGLSRLHPRWAGTVLCYESELVYPDPSWVEGEIVPPEDLPAEPLLPAIDARQFDGGEDRYADLVPEDFFDAWTQGDPEPGSGIFALTHLADLSSVVVPDLYSHQTLPARGDILDEPLGSGRFETCLKASRAEQQAEATAELPGLFLDPRIPADRQQIVVLQQRVVALAETLCNFVALLDVPTGLDPRQILRWRSRFRSSYAAAYHPWLKVTRQDARGEALILVNPSAAAAGIIARQELRSGISHGPANVRVKAAVDVAEAVSPERHDQLHPRGINVFLRERDGVRLTAGRTLASDPRYRQLTVRRLMIMLRRVLEQQTHWMVFEPNGPALRAEVRQMLRTYLRQLFIAGAFRGAVPEEAYFVRCDEELNPEQVVDSGQLIAEIGVVPSEPLEFIVLHLRRGGDGTLTVEE